MRSKKAGGASKKRAASYTKRHSQASKRKSVKKKAIKKATARRKSVAKKVAAKKAPSKKKISRKPPGYNARPSGVLVPDENIAPVSPSKLRSGFAKAKTEIDGLIEEIISTMTDDYVISEIELAASFSADGKFMGFGVGGAATIIIRIAPEM